MKHQGVLWSVTWISNTLIKNEVFQDFASLFIKLLHARWKMHRLVCTSFYILAGSFQWFYVRHRISLRVTAFCISSISRYYNSIFIFPLCSTLSLACYHCPFEIFYLVSLGDWHFIKEFTSIILQFYYYFIHDFYNYWHFNIPEHLPTSRCLRHMEGSNRYVTQMPCSFELIQHVQFVGSGDIS